MQTSVLPASMAISSAACRTPVKLSLATVEPKMAGTVKSWRDRTFSFDGVSSCRSSSRNSLSLYKPRRALRSNSANTNLKLKRAHARSRPASSITSQAYRRSSQPTPCASFRLVLCFTGEYSSSSEHLTLTGSTCLGSGSARHRRTIDRSASVAPSL